MEKSASLYKSEGSLVNAAKLIFHLQCCHDILHKHCQNKGEIATGAKSGALTPEFTIAECWRSPLERFSQTTNHSCSCFALTAHISPQNLLGFHLIYHYLVS